jgi:hypothetical protein
MKIDLALARVADSEASLADELVAVGARHAADQDLFWVTRTLARMEQGHLDSLARHGRRYGVGLDRDDGGLPGPIEAVRKVVEKGSELIAHRPEPALLLLSDLRKLYLGASGVSIDWTMLAQGAQAVRDTALLSVVTECHGQTLRTVNWCTYRIKTAAPQVLAT